MIENSDAVSVLIISSSESSAIQLKKLFDDKIYYPVEIIKSSGEAKRNLVFNSYGIVVINAPLSDDNGIELAIDISENKNTGVILIVKNDIYEQVSYKTEKNGIFCISRPISLQIITQSIRILTALNYRFKKLEMKNETLKSKMEEIRLVNRAKCVLIENLKITEAQAHRYIEKQAMDMCIKRIDVAKNILKTYDDK